MGERMLYKDTTDLTPQPLSEVSFFAKFLLREICCLKIFGSLPAQAPRSMSGQPMPRLSFREKAQGTAPVIHSVK